MVFLDVYIRKKKQYLSLMYANVFYMHVSLYVVWRVHPSGG
jgi:hypothetical protein